MSKLNAATPQWKEHNFKLGQAFYTVTVQPVRATGMTNQEGEKTWIVPNLFFTSFIDLATKYAYFVPLPLRGKTEQSIDLFFSTLTDKWVTVPAGVITDNDGEYTRKTVREQPGDMDIEHVPTIGYNSDCRAL